MPRSESGADLAVLARHDAIPLAVGGLPSPESIFAIHCVAQIVRRTRGGARVIPMNVADNVDALTEAALAEPAVPFFDAPDRGVYAALLALRVPIVVVMGDFGETAHFCMVARGLDALQAARFVSQSFACLEPLQRLDQVRTVIVNRAAALADWIDEVAGWLGLQPLAWHNAREQMLAEYAAWPTVDAAIVALVNDPHAVSTTLEHQPDETRSLFAALSAYYRPGAINTLFWPDATLLEPGDAPFSANDAISLTGPARVLTFGPSLHLPPGRWHARYQFEVDQHPAGNLIEVDIVHSGTVLVAQRALIEQAGKFGLDCAFEIEEPRLPVENRAILAEGAIGGCFNPIGIWLTRDE